MALAVLLFAMLETTVLKLIPFTAWHERFPFSLLFRTMSKVLSSYASIPADGHILAYMYYLITRPVGQVKEKHAHVKSN